MLVSNYSGILIGFEMTNLTALESDGSVTLIVSVLSGTIEGRSININFELTDGTALCK